MKKQKPIPINDASGLVAVVGIYKLHSKKTFDKAIKLWIPKLTKHEVTQGMVKYMLGKTRSKKMKKYVDLYMNCAFYYEFPINPKSAAYAHAKKK